MRNIEKEEDGVGQDSVIDNKKLEALVEANTFPKI